MEILYYLSALCLLLFMVLATYDGLYLHIWKYALFNRKESVFEHKTHTIRALLFPLILWMLFINSDVLSFWIGMVLVAIDLMVLGIDAYSEKDSRKHLGGLPKWEYILHLFANSFHFAAVILMVGTSLKIDEFALELVFNDTSSGKRLIEVISVNMIPGAIVLGILHLLLLLPKGREVWTKNRAKITCC